MKNRLIIGVTFILLFTTFISQKKISVNKFKVQEIKFENNKILKEFELIEDLSFLYNKSMIFLNSYEIKKKIEKKSFIKRLEVKKIYPNKLIIRIFEKEPIAILIDKKKKFFIGKKYDLIEYKKIPKYKNLPTIFGDQENFQSLITNLKKISFPVENIQKYFLLSSNRWDIQMKDKKIIKLPVKNYNSSLKNFLKINKNKNFDKYKIFDYRLNNQLILK